MDDLSGRVTVAVDDFANSVKTQLSELKMAQSSQLQQIESLEAGKKELEDSCTKLETQLKTSQDKIAAHESTMAEVKASSADLEKQNAALKGAVDDILQQHNALVTKMKVQESLANIDSATSHHQPDALPEASDQSAAKAVGKPFKRPAPRKSLRIKPKEVDWLKSRQQRLLQPEMRPPFQRDSSAAPSCVTLGPEQGWFAPRDSPRKAMAAYEMPSRSGTAEVSDEAQVDGLLDLVNKRKRSVSVSGRASVDRDSEGTPTACGKRLRSKTNENVAPSSQLLSSDLVQPDGDDTVGGITGEDGDGDDDTEDTITVTKPQDREYASISADKTLPATPGSTTTSILFQNVDSVLKAVCGDDTPTQTLQSMDPNIERPEPAKLGQATPSPQVPVGTYKYTDNAVADQNGNAVERPTNAMTRSQLLTQFQPRTDAMQRSLHSPNGENVAFDRIGGRLRAKPSPRGLREDEMDSRLLTRREKGGSGKF